MVCQDAIGLGIIGISLLLSVGKLRLGELLREEPHGGRRARQLKHSELLDHPESADLLYEGSTRVDIFVRKAWRKDVNTDFIPGASFEIY